MPTSRIVSIAFVVAIGLAACSTPDPTSAPAVSPATAVPTGVTSLAKSSVSSSPSHDDPRRAAVVYVASTDELMAHSPVGRREILRKLVTVTALDGQVTSFENAAGQLATTLNVAVERLVWVEAPLTATVVAATATVATVDVWTVSILGAPTTGSPQQVWRTVHVHLVLVGERWLVDTASADQGPTPAGNELAIQSDWKQFDVVAAWPAVVPGVGL
jgi:hypothetical protein